MLTDWAQKVRSKGHSLLLFESKAPQKINQSFSSVRGSLSLESLGGEMDKERSHSDSNSRETKKSRLDVSSFGKDIKQKANESLANLVSLLVRHIDEKELFDLSNTSLAIHRLGKLKGARRPTDEEIDIGKKLARIALNFDEYRYQAIQVSMTCYGIANGQLQELTPNFLELFDRLLRSVDNFQAWDPQAISNLLWSCTKLPWNSLYKTIFDKATREILYRRFHDFQMPIILWSYAKAQIKDDHLFEVFAGDVDERQFEKYNPQNISNVLWSFAKLDIKKQRIFDFGSKEICKRQFTSFNSQEISNILHSFAKLEIYHQQVFDLAVQEIVRRKLQNFDLQSIAHILWSFAKVDLRNDYIFELASSEIYDRNLRRLGENEISMILWSFGTLRIKNVKVINAISDELCSRKFRSFDDHSIGNILLSYAWW